MMIITVTPKHSGKFVAHLGDRQLCVRTFTPFLAAARVLAAEGHDPKTKIVMRYKGSDVDALISTVGAASHLAVDESERTRFVKHAPLGGNPRQGLI